MSDERRPPMFNRMMTDYSTRPAGEYEKKSMTTAHLKKPLEQGGFKPPSQLAAAVPAPPSPPPAPPAAAQAAPITKPE